MFPITRRCTICYGGEIAASRIEEALADVSNLFANGLLGDGTRWTAFPVRGPSRRMGGDRKLAEQVHRRIREINEPALAQVSIAVTDTMFASLVASIKRGPSITVVEPGSDPEFLAPATLHVAHGLGMAEAETTRVLTQLGYKTLGSLAAVEQTLLRDRFGNDGVRLWHIANGHEVVYTSFQEPHEEIVREVSFEYPLQLAEQIVFGVRAVVEEIVDVLKKETRLCTQFTLVLETDHAEVCERMWNFSHGFNARSMIERARWQLEEWLHAGGVTAGITIARFCVHATRPAYSEQLSLWGNHSGTDTDAARLVGKLTGSCGADAVNIAVWRGGRDATEMYALVPALDLDLVDVETTARMQNPPRHEGPWRGVLPSPLPALTVEPPERVRLCDDSDRTVGVTRRCELTAIPHRLVRADGSSVEVLTWAGPWPVEERWWVPRHARRVVQMQVVLLGDDDAEMPALLVMRHGEWVLTARYV